MKNEIHEFLKEYENRMKKFTLPLCLENSWIPVKCLKDGENNWTLLVKEESSEILCVLKWASGAAEEMLLQEFEILKELEQLRIPWSPKAYRYVQEDGLSGGYLLREYIEGQSLYEKVESEGCFSEGEILRVGKALCQMVAQFQALPTPLVHRDLKPENLVLTPRGELAIIDFGTVRRFNMEKQGSDTFVAGSRGTAAPEQYGYAQTDERTDVYAIGRTILYMATGGFEENALEEMSGQSRLFGKFGSFVMSGKSHFPVTFDETGTSGETGSSGTSVKPVSKRLKRVIRKCTAFDPKKRYKNAKSVEKVLSRNAKLWKTYLPAAAAGILVLGIPAGMIGYKVQRLERLVQEMEKSEIAQGKTTLNSPKGIETQESDTPKKQQKIVSQPENSRTGQQNEEMPVTNEAETNTETITFQEPLIEQAVRAELDLSSEELLTPEQLAKVSSIRILGEHILSEEDQFGWIGSNLMNRDWDFGSKKGSILSLSDLTFLPNLTDVEICNQKIRDIAPLSELPIQKLYLSDNLITDFSPLAQLPWLKELCIQGNPGVDLEALGECSRLRSLRISQMMVKNLDFLKELTLYELGMEQLQITEGDFSPLKAQQKLGTLYISDVDEEKAAVIRELNGLENLSLRGEQEIENLKSLSGMKKLIFVGIASSGISLEGIEGLPALRGLDLYGSKLTDISGLSRAKGIKKIDISYMAISDLTPLFQMEALETVVCDEKTKARILKISRSPNFQCTEKW